MTTSSECTTIARRPDGSIDIVALAKILLVIETEVTVSFGLSGGLDLKQRAGIVRTNYEGQGMTGSAQRDIQLAARIFGGSVPASITGQ